MLDGGFEGSNESGVSSQDQVMPLSYVGCYASIGLYDIAFVNLICLFFGSVIKIRG